MIKQLISLGFVLSLAACGADSDDGFGPDNGGTGSGSLSFTYAGDGGNGSFQASGAAPTNNSLGTWAGGARVSDEGETTVLVTAVTKSGSDYDMIGIQLDGNAPGTYDMGGNCETNCAYAVAAFGITSWTDSGERACFIDEGTVTVTALSATEARGTFSGKGSCMTDEEFDEPFQVSGGTFDVKVIGLGNG